jgi:hypothetical protein
MAEVKVSTGALSDIINGYLELLESADKIEVALSSGGRKELEKEKRDAILESLKKASGALASGCQQGVYGHFVTNKRPRRRRASGRRDLPALANPAVALVR